MIMTWITEEDSWRSALNKVPSIADRFIPYYDAQWHLPQIPATTLELCRLRLAQLHQSAAEFASENVALPPGKRNELLRWASSTSFDAAEKACLELTEVYAMDVTAITDEQAEAVKVHYGDAGLVALIQSLGVFYGMTRVSLLWDLPVANT